jgi:SAM-dependent methyltransferase
VTSLRAIARSVLPWRLRKLALSAADDLRTLPGRARRPGGWSEPWAVLHNVGGGDFVSRGARTMDTVRGVAGLFPNDRVIDAGCGVGALANALAPFLTRDGGYIGFDISRYAIGFARKRFAHRRPDFRFEFADLRNGEYAPGGARSAAGYRFPAEDESQTLAVAASLYTHLAAEDAAAYLRETARVLAPGGRAVCTFFLMDDAGREAVRAGVAHHAFASRALGGWTSNPETPETAIAHELPAVLAWVASAGLTLDGAPRRGSWREAAGSTGAQDLLVLRKPV